MKRIAIMTGGGDCPGLNAAIRAVTRAASNQFDYEVIGIRDGFEGLIMNDVVDLRPANVRGILRVGGTILGSSNRTNPFRYSGPLGNDTECDASEEAYRNLSAMDVEALVVIGGDGTLILAEEFAALYDVPLVGIPKTIDNDVHGSDYAIGFDSAVATVADAIDKLHTTAESHHRVFLVEAMGRTTGWLALYAGVAAGADIVLIPERKYSFAGIVDAIDRRTRSGHHFTVAVVAEGVATPDGEPVYQSKDGAMHNWKLGGVCGSLMEALGTHLDQEVRTVVLGHLQRGGAPTAFDRNLATQLGTKAVEAVAGGNHHVIVGLDGLRVRMTALADVARGPRVVDHDHPLIDAATQMGMYLG